MAGGDLSELKGILIAGTLVATMVFLMTLIPPQLYAASYEGRTIETDDYFSAVDIERYGNTFNYTLDGTDATLLGGWYSYIVEVGGHTLNIWYVEANSSSTGLINMNHCEVWAGIIVAEHALTFFYNGIDIGIYVTKAQMNNSAADLTYEMQCNHINLDLYFSYNTTLYSSPTDALDHNELKLLIGVTWDQLATSMSAWDLVALILLFQLPNVHWAVNALIAVPVYLCMIYIAVVLILKVLDVIIPL